MNRLRQAILIGSFLPLCWLAMMAIHELGHVIAAWATGGRVVKVVVHPLAISRTDAAPNPRPLVVAWGGPAFGAAAPLALWGALSARSAYLARFFAGFCLVVNGLYLGVGSFWAVGDAGDLVRHGAPTWTLWLFGVATTPFGLWLWHRQGERFGFGESRGRVDAWAAYGSLAALLAALLAAGALSERF